MGKSNGATWLTNRAAECDRIPENEGQLQRVDIDRVDLQSPVGANQRAHIRVFGRRGTVLNRGSSSGRLGGNQHGV